MQKRHFHSYDAFRFFAFFKVYIFHATAIVVAAEGSLLEWIKKHPAFGGGIGVSFFFVLSGFLITYILAWEKIQAGKISLGKFFLRRAFRIWPLFLALVALAFLIPYDTTEAIGFHMNGGGYDPDWRYSFTFLENYKTIAMDTIPKTTPLSVFWSLCIEEHFYIVWMFVFFLIPRKWIPWYLLSAIIVAIVLRINHDEIYATQNVVNNDLFTNLDYFALSGLLGYFVALKGEKVEALILRIPLALRITYVALLVAALFWQDVLFNYDTAFYRYFKCTLYALLFTILLAFFLPSSGPLKIGEKNILTRLGKISYGLYVFHIVWIHVVYQYCLNHGIKIDTLTKYGIYMTLTFAGTLITSWLSWKLFEKPILNLRERWFGSKGF